MKKKMAMALVVLLLASTGAWAWEYPAAEGTVIGTGIGLMLVPLLVDNEDGSWDWCYWVGGGVSLLGLIWMIVDMSSDSSGGSGSGYYDDDVVEDFSYKKKNFIREHLRIDSMPNGTHIGLSFNF